jgi:hypothetical protein
MAQAPKQPQPQPEKAPAEATREVVTVDGKTVEREVRPDGMVIEVRLS